MKLLNVVILLSILIFTVTATQAENLTASIEIGSTSTSLNTSNIINKYTQLTSSSNISTDASSLLLSLGYTLDKYLSIGSDLIISGSVTASESGINYKLFSTDTVAVYAKIGTAINSRISVYGKLGVHLWSLSENLSAPGGLDDGVDITYGISTNIDLYGGSDRQLQVQWNHYEYNDVYVESQDVASLGILFLF